jgi:hypothetical protein
MGDRIVRVGLRRRSSAATVAGIALQPQAFACATCQRTRSSSDARGGIR